MNKQYYFITGLPRSGSTLLAGILNQNPKFHASMSTSLASIFQLMFFKDDHTTLTLSNEQHSLLLKNIIESYYHDISKPVIFDTSRGWVKFDSVLARLFPYTKLFCCLRDVPSILNSFEYFYKFKTYKLPPFILPEDVHNPFYRIDQLYEHMVRGWYEHCDYSFHSPALKKFYHYIDYDNLVSDPEKTIRDLYDSIGMEYYKHDFNNVEYSEEDVDKNADCDNLHTVNKKVQKTNTPWILPHYLTEKYSFNCFWKN